MNFLKSGLSFFTAALLAASSTLALAQTCNPNIPLSKPDNRYTYNSVGDEVTDTVTGLIWKRCVEGMSYSGGTCTLNGSATTFTWEGALKHAATQSGWRIPNIKELKSLVETACHDKAINHKAFPTSPNEVWSSSVTMKDYKENYAWFTDFVNGHTAYYRLKSKTLSVRLVRDQPA